LIFEEIHAGELVRDLFKKEEEELLCFFGFNQAFNDRFPASIKTKKTANSGMH